MKKEKVLFFLYLAHFEWQFSWLSLLQDVVKTQESQLGNMKLNLREFVAEKKTRTIFFILYSQ